MRPPRAREHVPGETAPARRRDSVHAVRTARILRWSGVAIAVVILVVVIGQGARSIFSSADVVAGTIALRLTPPGNSAGLPVASSSRPRTPSPTSSAARPLSSRPVPAARLGSSIPSARRSRSLRTPRDLSPSSTAQVDAVAAALVARNLTGSRVHPRLRGGHRVRTTQHRGVDRARCGGGDGSAGPARRQARSVPSAGLGAADPLAAQSSDGQTAVNRRVLVLYPAVR